jgi:glycosyltransferase involved in cell wall biosynthesis
MIRGSDNTWSRKALLKDVAARYFPRGFLDRPKMGFAIPITKWFKPGTQLWSVIRDRIACSSSPLTNYFDPKAISNLLESRHAANIWQLLFFDEWLRQSSAVIEKSPSVAPFVVDIVRSQKTRPRILILADVPRWIFERHALTLQESLADEFDIDVGYMGDAIDESCYDLVYPLEWNLVPPHQIRTPIKWITGVRSHISWNEKNPDEFGWIIREKFQQVHAVSERLCKELKGFREDIVSLTHGIDLNRFQPQSEPFSNPTRIRIGWAGNRRSPAKGFEQFIAPLADIPGVELVFCGYSDHLMNLDEMRHFYESIDIYICSSSTEGNNNSLLEAASMGRAIVTTDVGTVSEYLVHERSALVVPRSADAFRTAVERLQQNPQLGISLGKAARAAVEPFSWKRKLDEHRNFLRGAIRVAREALSIQLSGESGDDSFLSTTAPQNRVNHQQLSSGLLHIL